jgi:hypothetical protein
MKPIYDDTLRDMREYQARDNVGEVFRLVGALEVAIRSADPSIADRLRAQTEYEHALAMCKHALRVIEHASELACEAKAAATKAEDWLTAWSAEAIQAGLIRPALRKRNGSLQKLQRIHRRVRAFKPTSADENERYRLLRKSCCEYQIQLLKETDRHKNIKEIRKLRRELKRIQ